jgi:lipopolysaccharide export system protein LptC
MSIKADQQRTAREKWALPGGRHDFVVRWLKILLPCAVGVISAFLALAPFTHSAEVSFVLDKNKVDVASERMRVREALYRGEDSRGRPFSIRRAKDIARSRCHDAGSFGAHPDE